MNDLSIYFDRLGIGAASADVKEKILLELGREIMKQLLIDLRSALSEEAFLEIERAASTGDLRSITVALGRHLPEAEKFIERSAHKVIQEFIAAEA